jgi:DNA-binding MarR family transcriptional regulator
MTRYSPLELGEVQKQILKHFFLCKENKRPESVSHIAKELRVLQPSVYRSVDLLIKEKYLLKENDFTRKSGQKYVEKNLILTEKGAAAAVILGGTFDEFENYFKRQRHPDIEILQFIKRIYKTSEKRDLIIKKAMEYAFKNNYFDKGSTIRQLTEEELKKLRLYMAMEYINSLGPTSNIRSLKEFIDRYQLDREIMKEYLNQQKQFADLLLRELDK